jgi:hypothetical protein
MVAVKGETACAAALYSDAQMNDKNTFSLSGLIRNAGETCRGAGAAILCYLIRNSKDKRGQFSPLRLTPIEGETLLKEYYEPFGCTSAKKMPWDFLSQEDVMDCNDPKPQKCESYMDGVIDADKFLRDIPEASERQRQKLYWEK